jgi:hypothetical protein
VCARDRPQIGSVLVRSDPAVSLMPQSRGTLVPLGGGTAMRLYKAYVFNATGQIFGPPIEICANDDAEAMGKAAALAGEVQVWEGARLVARLDTASPNDH